MAFLSMRRQTFFRDGRTRVVVSRQPHQAPMVQHRHEFLELAVVLSGEGVHVTGQFQHRIQAGDVLVLSRLRPHGYERTQGLNLINILIREDSLQRLARDLRHLPGFHALFVLESLRWNQQSYASRLRLNASDLAQINEWANRLEEEIARVRQGGNVLAEAYLTLIMGLLVRRYDRPARQAKPAAARPEAGMGRLLSWVEVHLAERLTVAALARQTGMSVRSFYRHFHATIGQTPLDYVLGQRIARAKELLATHRSEQIDAIAAQCGFEDGNYFSRVFNQRTGMTPRQYSSTYKLTKSVSRVTRSKR